MEEEVAETVEESQVYMACIIHGHRVGVAYYDANIHQLFVIEFWEDGNGELPLIDLVKYQVKPLVIYASTKTDELFLAALQRNVSIETFEVKLIRSSIFSYEQAWHRDKFLKLDAAAHEALQIFQVDKHPSDMGIGRAKEGFSVFGMFNKCVTPMGRRLLRAWFLRPILDLDIVVVLHQIGQISFFLCCEEVMSALRETLKTVRDVPHMLKKFNSPSSLCTTSDWNAFLKVMGVIDVKRSKEKGYETLVKEGLCDELDELRMIYERLPDFLEQVSAYENASVPVQHGWKKAPSIVYVHQIGYLMCIFDEKLTDETLGKLHDFEFAFSEDGDEKRFFYHTPKTKELDNLLGDIYHKILDMERAIIRDLITRVLNFVPQLIKAVNFAAELDCILSLALIAHQNNYVRPILTGDTFLDIKNGRHALQEMTVDTFVPNDTKILNDGRINIITGPNYSGKSIYVKQVALVVYLSHIGSFIPADSATIGITDRIFCAMGNKPTITEQSTFMIDLHQVGMMLRQATSHSLCLIDEFGKGTLTEDGIGLLGGAINHFANYEHPPKVLLCTHLTEIFDKDCLPQSENIKFYTMSVLKPDSNCTSTEDIIFLYRLVPGQAPLSYGLHCARLAGVPAEVVERAADILEMVKSRWRICRFMNQTLSAKDQQYQDAVAKLLGFDTYRAGIFRESSLKCVYIMKLCSMLELCTLAWRWEIVQQKNILICPSFNTHQPNSFQEKPTLHQINNIKSKVQGGYAVDEKKPV
ncbi:hypothetical protein OPV22_016766 [Ensete ventricosum]|uniref:DNA mismatch repair protein MSH5 n=1 Tax=Ensete ventricosum TaxID=4639 RepID=A0AAV8PH55_ENSVE|nr:hypothetical protein OPV22_016766 [Ensete ventricosum]